MKYEDLVAFYVRPADAAKAIGVDRRVVSNWQGRRIPSKQQLRYESLTGGALQADEEAHKEAEEFARLASPEARVG